jgi:hypothetical protein
MLLDSSFFHALNSILSGAVWMGSMTLRHVVALSCDTAA